MKNQNDLIYNLMVPHCNCCEHFTSCFYTDKDTEWGYCTEILGDTAPTRKETDAIKTEVDSGNWDRLNELRDLGVLFVPKAIDCAAFVDNYPQ